jgi:hypothetical protein
VPERNCDEPSIWFLDFESNKAGIIFLAGVLNAGNFQQIILDQRLSGIANNRSLAIMSPLEFVEELIDEIKNTNGVIAAFSNAEKKMIDNIYLESGKDTPDYRYCNLHSAAKRWVKRFRKKEFTDLPPLKKTANKYEAKRHPYSLASIMRLLDHKAPTDYAIGKTTKRINAVISGLKAKKGIYENLTPTQKRQATQLLKHNEFDVVSLPFLTDKISSTDLSLFSKSGWVPSAPTKSETVKTREKVVKEFGLEIKTYKMRKKPSEELGKIRDKFPKAYKRWSSDEEHRLIKLFQGGLSIDEISKALDRQIGGIKSRLIRLELLDPDENTV